MNTNPITDLSFWEDKHANLVHLLPPGGEKPSWLRQIAPYFPAKEPVTCFEVGAVPGPTLLYLAHKPGMKVTGLDFNPDILELEKRFHEEGVSGEFILADFLTWQPAGKYDFVYSNGFIEHFTDISYVVRKHWELVTSGGLMLISIPVLTPIQYLLRWLFYSADKWREIKETHNQQVTPKVLLNALQSLPGARLLKCGYTSEFHIWFNIKDRGIRRWLAPLYYGLKALDVTLRKCGLSSRWYSPEYFGLCQKGVT